MFGIGEPSSKTIDLRRACVSDNSATPAVQAMNARRSSGRTTPVAKLPRLMRKISLCRVGRLLTTFALWNVGVSGARSGGDMKVIIDQIELAQIATLIAMVVTLGAV
jgi:hypothetical protein